MNAVAAVARDSRREDTQGLEAVLIAICSLSPAVVADIRAAQARFDLPFAEAAKRLRHITSADIDAALQQEEERLLRGARSLKPDRQLLVAHDPFNTRSEAIRALRTELLLRHEADNASGANSFAVVSPCAGEGRSLLAAELAISFAQLGQSTLLVDADLRRSRLHRLFDVDNDRGLAQAIVADGVSCVHPVHNLPQMALLTSGKASPSPLELLSDRRYAELVASWRRRYTHIVIDTPPAAQFSDALASAALCGRVLMLSRAKHTPYRETREMLRRLSATQSRILGAVISHF